VERLISREKLQLWFNGEEYAHLDQSDIKLIEELKESDKQSESCKRALKYGIGVHTRMAKGHEKYLHLVEDLFKHKKLKFVIATGSLAFGLNMPADNVVFLGPSMYLSPQIFRQCAGRAGRRGFGDGVGKVYMLGFGEEDISRLLCSPLDALTPQVPYNPSFLLCAIVNCVNIDERYRQIAVNNLMRVMQRPLFEKLIQVDHMKEMFRRALGHTALFTSIMLVNRVYCDYNDPSGRPCFKSQPNSFLHVDGSPLVKALAPYELHYNPYCWLLGELLQRLGEPGQSDLGFAGLLRSCRTDEELRGAVLRTILSISDTSETYSKFTGYVMTGSCVPEPVLKVFAEFNKATILQFVQYMQFQAAALPDNSLPLRDARIQAFPPCQYECSSALAWQPFIDWTKEQGIAFDTSKDHSATQASLEPGRPSIPWLAKELHRFPVACSAFSVLSGHGDEFEDVTDMELNSKDGVFVSRSVMTGVSPPERMWNTVEEIFKGKCNFFERGMIDKDGQQRCESFRKVLDKVVRVATKTLDCGTNQDPNSDSRKILRAMAQVKNEFGRQFAIAKESQGQQQHQLRRSQRMEGKMYLKCINPPYGHIVDAKSGDRADFHISDVIYGVANVREGAYATFEVWEGRLNHKYGNLKAMVVEVDRKLKENSASTLAASSTSSKTSRSPKRPKKYVPPHMRSDTNKATRAEAETVLVRDVCSVLQRNGGS
jgi:hypothetical protein